MSLVPFIPNFSGITDESRAISYVLKRIGFVDGGEERLVFETELGAVWIHDNFMRSFSTLITELQWQQRDPDAFEDEVEIATQLLVLLKECQRHWVKSMN